MDRLQVLVLEDRAADAELMTTELRRAGFSFDWHRVDSERDFAAHLNPPPDLILADFNMPQFTAVRALQMLRELGLDIPAIIVSGSIGEDVAVRALQEGAADYLLKDRLTRLGAAASHALEAKRLRDKRRQTEEELTRERSLLRTMIDTLPDFISIKDRDSRFLLVNQAYAQFLGQNTPDDLRGKTVRDVYPPDLAAQYLADDQMVLDTKKALLNQESRTVDQSGNALWHLVNKVPLRNGAGEIAGIVSIARDITAHKHAEEQIARQLDTLTALYSTAQRLAHNLNLDELARDTVERSVKDFGARLAWVGRAEPGTPVVVQDIPAERSLPNREALVKLGITCAAAFPLISRDKPFGVLVLYGSTADFFSPARVEFFQTFANQAASALENARLFEETATRLEQLQALRNIDVFDARMQTLRSAVGRGFRSKAHQAATPRLGEGPAGRAALERQIVVVKDLAAEPTEVSGSLKLSGEGFVGYVAAPLIAKGQVGGVLEVFWRSSLTATPERLAFLEALSGQAAIAIDNADLFTNLQRANLDLMMAYDATIEGWSKALDLRDKETEGHTLRVTELTLRLARAMGVPDDLLIHLRRGALLHDIGKVGIPDSILLKPGPLSAEEWEIMRRHPVHAFELLASIPYLREALDIPYCHHEKWDGTGYPRKLRGPQIPLLARIFAIVDVYDALTSDRPYRPAWSKEKALAHIREQSGTHFDPDVVAAFLGLEEVAPRLAS